MGLGVEGHSRKTCNRSEAGGMMEGFSERVCDNQCIGLVSVRSEASVQ